MIKDINNKIAEYEVHNIDSLEELFDMSVCRIKDPIGFLRYNPAPQDGRFGNKLQRYRWYAIESIDRHSFNLDNGLKIHFSLTDSIVPTKGNETLFNKFKQESKIVLDYYRNKKLSEQTQGLSESTNQIRNIRKQKYRA